ncbi:peroxidase 15-like [Cucurbita pepo subsp. pepo]|uniref:peroxidase 15-like n=1 Tax=Cucurbita pepo subsp. pepo TaxID=3664 RepID=UPI000C9D36C7|nr:peroxidase 15-like [Cucurbita pepo subsp. pepo]
MFLNQLCFFFSSTLKAFVFDPWFCMLCGLSSTTATNKSTVIDRNSTDLYDNHYHKNLLNPNSVLKRCSSKHHKRIPPLNGSTYWAPTRAHTFGRSTCVFFSGRLSNFNGTASPDPTLDPTYRDALIIACPTGDGNNRIAPDVASPDDFDNAYYTDLVGNRGLLQSDQELFSTEGAETIAAVNRFATNQSDFFAQFA